MNLALLLFEPASFSLQPYKNLRQVVAATHGVNMHTNTREFLLVSSLLLILIHPHPRPPSSPTFAIALKLILASPPPYGVSASS